MGWACRRCEEGWFLRMVIDYVDILKEMVLSGISRASLFPRMMSLRASLEPSSLPRR